MKVSELPRTTLRWWTGFIVRHPWPLATLPIVASLLLGLVAVTSPLNPDAQVEIDAGIDSFGVRDHILVEQADAEVRRAPAAYSRPADPRPIGTDASGLDANVPRRAGTLRAAARASSPPPHALRSRPCATCRSRRSRTRRSSLRSCVHGGAMC